MTDMQPISIERLYPHIVVIGVGGGGGNAVANMIANGVRGVQFIVANTDAQALNGSPSHHRIQLGRHTTDGLGAGSAAEIGRLAAEESIEAIVSALRGAHMVFIAAGMGGGTGTGAAPVIARAARALGILTVGVVTRPFDFEGRRRRKTADAGIAELEQHVDTLIVIPNQNLFRVATAETTFKMAFEMADDVLSQGVRSISDLMVAPGLVNLDFADLCSVMGGMGLAMIGTGEATGRDRATTAAALAIANPLLDGVMDGARGLIISIVGGDDLGLVEIDEAASYISQVLDPDAQIIWGSAVDPSFTGRFRVSIIATGLKCGEETPCMSITDIITATQAQQPVIEPVATMIFAGPSPMAPAIASPAIASPAHASAAHVLPAHVLPTGSQLPLPIPPATKVHVEADAGDCLSLEVVASEVVQPEPSSVTPAPLPVPVGKVEITSRSYHAAPGLHGREPHGPSLFDRIFNKARAATFDNVGDPRSAVASAGPLATPANVTIRQRGIPVVISANRASTAAAI